MRSTGAHWLPAGLPSLARQRQSLATGQLGQLGGDGDEGLADEPGGGPLTWRIKWPPID